MSITDLINKLIFEFNEYNVPAQPYQISFQEAATPVMNGLLDLHDYVFFFVVIILCIVLVILIQIVQVFSSSNNKDINFFSPFFITSLSLFNFSKFYNYIKNFFCFILSLFYLFLWFGSLLKTIYNTRFKFKIKSWIINKKINLTGKNYLFTSSSKKKLNNILGLFNNNKHLKKQKDSIISSKNIFLSHILESDKKLYIKDFLKSDNKFENINLLNNFYLENIIGSENNNINFDIHNFVNSIYLDDFFSFYIILLKNRDNIVIKDNMLALFGAETNFSNDLFFSIYIIQNLDLLLELDFKEDNSLIENVISTLKISFLYNIYYNDFFQFHKYFIILKNVESFKTMFIRTNVSIYSDIKNKISTLLNLVEVNKLFFNKNENFSLFNLESTIGNFILNIFSNSTLIKLYRVLKIGYFNHSTRLEIVWTIIPILIIGLIITPSFFFMYAIDEDMESLLTIRVIGHQWYWSYVYALPSYILSDDSGISSIYNNHHINLNNFISSEKKYFTFDSYMADNMTDGSPRLLSTDTILLLPKYFHVNCIVTSTDVLHSWALPALGVKIDAVPGRLNRTDIFLEHEGMFFGQCSELCGVNHSFMPIQLQSVSLSSFIKFLSDI
jgi:cytochrome c oxidase subunit 2